MKIAWLCLLSLTLTACQAESPRTTDLYSIYSGCFQGTVRGGLNSATEPKVTEEIHDFVNEVDAICFPWTLIWYPALTDEYLEELTEDEVDGFEEKRQNLMKGAIAEFDRYVNYGRR